MSEEISIKDMIWKISEYLSQWGGHNVDPREIWNSVSNGELDNIIFIYNQIRFCELQTPPPIYSPETILKKLFPNGYSFDKEGGEDRITMKPYGHTWTGNHTCHICKKKITTDQSTIVKLTNFPKFNKPANHEFSSHLSIGPNDLVHTECSEGKETKEKISKLPKYTSLRSLLDSGCLIEKDDKYLVQQDFAIPYDAPPIIFDKGMITPGGYAIHFNQNPPENKLSVFKLNEEMK